MGVEGVLPGIWFGGRGGSDVRLHVSVTKKLVVLYGIGDGVGLRVSSRSVWVARISEG